MTPPRTVVAFVVGACFLATAAHAASFTLASLATDGTLPSGFYAGDHAQVSADGRYVVFRSGEAHLATPSSSGYQVFLRDTKLNTTELVSQSSAGVPGNGSSDFPSVSNDGCLVAFESDSSNLVAGDTNGSTDVFLRDRCATPVVTKVVSVTPGGAFANGQSRHPSLSANGKVVAFWSYATDLLASPTHADNVFRLDLTTGTTVLVTDGSTTPGKGGNYGSDCPSVSDDGSRIAFWSLAYDLVSGDDYTVWDIFVWDANASPHVSRVSTNSSGAPQNFGNNGLSSITWPAISGDGKKVAWASESTNLVADDTNGVSDIFVKDTVTGAVTRASVKSGGAQLLAASAGRPSLNLDGSWVAFPTSAGDASPDSQGKTPTIALHHLPSGQTRGVAAVTSDEPALSHDATGAFVAVFLGAELDPAHLSSGVYLWRRNTKPVAAATFAPSAAEARTPGQVVTLDGSGSSDADGQALTFAWSQLSGPEAVTFSAPTSAVNTFTPGVEGTFVFQLVVDDGVEDSDPIFVTVDVGPAPKKTGCAAAGVDLALPALALLVLGQRRRRN